MTVTLHGYRVRLANRLGVPSGDTFFPPHVLNDAINQALQTIEEEGYWPWSEVVAGATLSSGSGSLVLADDTRAVKAVFVGSWELTQASLTDVMRWSTNQSGMPGVWASEGSSSIMIRPVAAGDQDVTIVYYRTQDLLSSDTDVPMIPDRFAPAVVAKAAELCARREDDGPQQAMHLADYSAWLTRMRRAVRSTTRPTTIRVRPGSWIDQPV